MDKVRFGIVGLGNQGTYYNLSLFDKGLIENGVVTALCDIDPTRIEAMREKTKNKAARCFTDYREMLDAGIVDAAIVVVPHYGHCEIARECLRRGIHVLCDKPEGVYTRQVRELNEFAAGQRALFGMIFNQRTDPLYKKMREMIAAGRIGNLQRVVWVITDWYRTQHYYDSGSWRATWAGEGGGVLINQCPHQLDLLQWVVGEMPARVHAFCHYGKWHDIEVEDDVTAYFEYASGTTGVFVTTTGEYPGCNRFEVSGTRGRLVCEGGKLTFTATETDIAQVTAHSPVSFATVPTATETIGPFGDGPQHAGIIRNFANAVLGREPLEVRGEDGIDCVMLINAIELSGWTGETIALPVDEERYLGLLRTRAAHSRFKVGRSEVEDPSVAF